jgi:cysteinyl-tRNA synthetase
MKWDSPWGVGCPGWHIECSAMSGDILGDHFDIHTGGIDHKPIHHENEIAQNDCAFGHRVVECWMHNEFLQVDGGKMSKSLNNIYTIDQLNEMGYEPLAYKYFCLNTSYAKKINFTFDAIKSAQVALNNLRKILQEHKNGTEKISTEVLEKYRQDFLNAINDNLNTPLALGVLFSMVKNEPKSEDVYNLAIDFDRVFGVGLDRVVEEKKEDIPNDIKELAKLRWQAKQQKDWANADKYRNEISEKGYVILDSKDGYKIEKK